MQNTTQSFDSNAQGYGMSAGISENGQKPGAVVPLLRYIAVGTITGLGFGLVMAIVSNGFVLGVKALSSLREGIIRAAQIW